MLVKEYCLKGNAMSKHGKVYRQLYLYEMAFTSQEVTMEEMIKKLGVCQKTIHRDIIDLTDATVHGFIKFLIFY